MNILIPYSWLKEYLATQASPEKMAECLSLCSASVEKILKIEGDSVFDMEITTNRVDMMSIAGIAREAAAVLPQFGIKASLKIDPYKTISNLKITSKSSKLKVMIKNPQLCSRFTAILLDNIKISSSPKIIQERLKKVGVRSLNNVIDISNYLMHELGQPVHVFDYDKIKNATMILRESEKGEKITTLDGKTHTLPGKDIVIEDGEGRLIDLCGIMGGENSCVDSQTKRVLLFVQNYKASQIRKTSMTLAQRTEAATLFEKNIDPELVMPTLIRGIDLIKKYANGKVASDIVDIYPNPYKPKNVSLKFEDAFRLIGVKIKPSEIEKILKSLGFKTIKKNKEEIVVSVPSFRADDVDMREDLVEEIARIYGYHNIPSSIPPINPLFGLEGKTNPQLKEFEIEKKLKHFLANLGFTETYSYSLISKKLIENFGLQLEDHLKISNPLSYEWEYLRTNLIPSTLKIIADNISEEKISIFEISNIYLPRKKNQIPLQKLKLVIASTAGDFWQIKGVVEALLDHLNIVDYKFDKGESNFLDSSCQAEIKSGREAIGQLGLLKNPVADNFSIKNKVLLAYLDFDTLASLSKSFKPFQTPPSYPPVIEDLTFVVKPGVYVQDLIQLIKEQSSIIQSVQLTDCYKNHFTFRITYQHPKQNLSTQQVGKIRKKIIAKTNQKKLGGLKKKEIN